ncbi:DNA-binding transcriptional regulator, GntR family [Prauserella alba]|nr:DNA-binding transcriptional regulator, GntR family [Prauserella alba]
MVAPRSTRPRPPGSKADYVHQVLREEIMSGELSAGTAVPQDEIARRLGVSITPVREALRRLESEGLISYRSHRGATVSELSSDAARELYLLRGAIEGLCARLAAERITDTELAALFELHEQMLREHEAGHIDDLAEHSRRFHDLIARAGGPALLAEHLDALWRNHPVPSTTSLWHEPGNAKQFLDQHGALLEALAAHDAVSAERAMVEHLDEAGAARNAQRGDS